jgi:hypothetical protein
MLGCIVTAGGFFIGCTPPPPVVTTNLKCPEPLWKEYSLFQSYKVKEEAARLEALLAAGDTASADSPDTVAAKKFSGLEIRKRLFELSIHHANSDYNFDRIFEYVSFLFQHGGPDSLRYLNWGRVVREQKTLLSERDSLEAVISALSNGDKKDSISVGNLKKEIKVYMKQCDSLTTVITTQQEMILKLQKLDVMMEQQRNKIK